MTRSGVLCPVCGGEHESVNVGGGMTFLPCPRVPTGHAVVTQGLTADELELVRLRPEVARLRRVIFNSASSLDGLLDDASEMGYQAHPRLVDALRWLARDLRGALAQGAPR